jgi:hypothetical protein
MGPPPSFGVAKLCRILSFHDPPALGRQFEYRAKGCFPNIPRFGTVTIPLPMQSVKILISNLNQSFTEIACGLESGLEMSRGARS